MSPSFRKCIERSANGLACASLSLALVTANFGLPGVSAAAQDLKVPVAPKTAQNAAPIFKRSGNSILGGKKAGGNGMFKSAPQSQERTQAPHPEEEVAEADEPKAQSWFSYYFGGTDPAEETAVEEEVTALQEPEPTIPSEPVKLEIIDAMPDPAEEQQSRVMKLAAEALLDEYRRADQRLATLNPPSLGLEELRQQVRLASETVAVLKEEIASIRTALNAMGGVSPELARDLADANGKLDKSRLRLGLLEQDAEAAENYRATLAFVIFAEERLEALGVF